MVKDQLDALLASWSQARLLGAEQAEAMRQEILVSVDELPAGWWADYLQQLNATLQRANQVQKTIAANFQFQQLSRLSTQIGWTPANASQWQPYLRVT